MLCIGFNTNSHSLPKFHGWAEIRSHAQISHQAYMLALLRVAAFPLLPFFHPLGGAQSSWNETRGDQLSPCSKDDMLLKDSLTFFTMRWALRDEEMLRSA